MNASKGIFNCIKEDDDDDFEIYNDEGPEIEGTWRLQNFLMSLFLGILKSGKCKFRK